MFQLDLNGFFLIFFILNRFILILNGLIVIMCGDYNSLPESGVAEFIQKGKVCLNHHEFRKLQYNRKLTKMNPKHGEVGFQNFKAPVKFTLVQVRHSGIFCAILSSSKCYKPEHLPYTNYTYDFRSVFFLKMLFLKLK